MDVYRFVHYRYHRRMVKTNSRTIEFWPEVGRFAGDVTIIVVPGFRLGGQVESQQAQAAARRSPGQPEDRVPGQRFGRRREWRQRAMSSIATTSNAIPAGEIAGTSPPPGVGSIAICAVLSTARIGCGFDPSSPAR